MRVGRVQDQGVPLQKHMKTNFVNKKPKPSLYLRK
jgi:hypothetical protein